MLLLKPVNSRNSFVILFSTSSGFRKRELVYNSYAIMSPLVKQISHKIQLYALHTSGKNLGLKLYFER